MAQSTSVRTTVGRSTDGTRAIAAPRLVTDPSERRRMQYELDVYQTELETQNEELRQIQLDLRESRDRYQELYDSAPVGYMTLDAQGRILELNRGAMALLGRPGDTIGHRYLSSFLEAQEADSFHLYLREVYSSGTTCSREFWFMSGAERLLVLLESVGIRSADGSLVGCRTVLINLTELRLAQAKVRTSESKTEMLLRTVVDAVLCVDGRGLIESCNPAAERMFGYSEAMLRQQKLDRLIVAHSVEVLAPQWFLSSGLELDTAKASNRIQVSGIRRDGSEFPAEIGVGNWLDGDQRKFTLIVRDVSAACRAQERLKASEERFRQIAENIEDMFYVSDQEGVLSYVSPAFHTIWGTAEQVQNSEAGQNHREVLLGAVHPEDLPRVMAAKESGASGLLDLEYRISRADGEIRWVRERAFPVEEHGNSERRIGIIQDITAERELEEGLRHAQKMEAVGTLASGIAHDFRNLLHGVMGCAQMALRKRAQPEQAEPYMQQIMDSVKRGAFLIDQLMQFSRKQRANPSSVAIDALLRNSVHLLEPMLGDHIQLKLELEAPRAELLADPGQLQQILMNLSGNARDAMREGGSVSIHTEEVLLTASEARKHHLAAPGQYLRLTFTDTGTGMDDATRSRIFEPFFTTKRLGCGTGLGLANVFATLTQLNGRVEVDTEPGKGTTFTLFSRAPTAPWVSCWANRLPSPPNCPYSKGARYSWMTISSCA